MSPSTPGRNVERTCALIISTAFSPATMSTPAPAYDMRCWSLLMRRALRREGAGDRQRVVGAVGVGAGCRLEHVLRVELGNFDGILAGEAGRAERVARLPRGRDESLDVEVG